MESRLNCIDVGMQTKFDFFDEFIYFLFVFETNRQVKNSLNVAVNGSDKEQRWSFVRRNPGQKAPSSQSAESCYKV